MKTRINFPTTLILFFSLVLAGNIQASVPYHTGDPCFEPPRWEKLGQRKVDRGLDHDEIFVTAAEGRFTKVKLVVRNSGINMHRMVIHFANGQTQEVNVRNNIPAGGETRVIDITGGKRVIKKVVFWYDTKGLINDKAIVELWGRH